MKKVRRFTVALFNGYGLRIQKYIVQERERTGNKIPIYKVIQRALDEFFEREENQ